MVSSLRSVFLKVDRKKRSTKSYASSALGNGSAIFEALKKIQFEEKNDESFGRESAQAAKLNEQPLEVGVGD